MELSTFADGVWLTDSPVSIVGMKLSSTMTVVELPGSELLLYSPVALTPERRAEIDALGAVTHLYAPNTFHQKWIGDWAAAYPQAKIHAPSALRPKLRVDRAHDREPLGELGRTFDEVHVEGCLLEESVLVHRATGTLVVADLVHNIGRPQQWWAKVYTNAMGFYDRVALSRVIRWTAFRDPTAARRSIDSLVELPFDRLVVGHGTPLSSGAHDALIHAYDWLKPNRAALALTGTPKTGFCG